MVVCQYEEEEETEGNISDYNRYNNCCKQFYGAAVFLLYTLKAQHTSCMGFTPDLTVLESNSRFQNHQCGKFRRRDAPDLGT